jgi:hypothetical protein
MLIGMVRVGFFELTALLQKRVARLQNEGIRHFDVAGVVGHSESVVRLAPFPARPDLD